MKSIYFTPGPTELYFTVPQHIKQALNDQLLSISHRSKTFEKIVKDAVRNLKTLMNIPDDFHIFFTNSSTETMERIMQNLVDEHSFHVVNGAFSNRLYNLALRMGKKAKKVEYEHATYPDVNQILISNSCELLTLTHNETSNGVTFPLSEIYALKEGFPDLLLVADVTSSVPYAEIDFTKIDSVFFSVQHGFGLPAGLGVWILNDKCVRKAKAISDTRASFGSFHSILSFYKKSLKYQTPETPNVLGIYLLSKVTEDFLNKGMDQIRRETNYKAALLYHTLENHSRLNIFVPEPDIRSNTIICATTTYPSNEVISQIAKKGMVLGSGYEKYKFQQVRIANYPAHSKEQVELLCDYFDQLVK
ncbi:MAG: aminotransferase class V-fold PLP-dependent enzyme [Candidatus Cyclobacteriaceae bacterium M3_2C_046]